MPLPGLSDGHAVYKIPMTYRSAPVHEGGADGSPWLITVAEHSVLGTRWIYDAARDQVWKSELIRLVRTEQVCRPGLRRGVRPAQARGIRLGAWPQDGAVAIDLRRTITPGPVPSGRGLIGAVMGTWHPPGAGERPANGCLAELSLDPPRK